MIERSDFIFETADVYHGKAVDYLSSHQLMRYEDSPALYAYRLEHPQEDTTAFRFGRACHSYILEGQDVFDAEYIVANDPDSGAFNKTTKKPYGYDTQAWKKWEKTQGKTGITETDFETVKAMGEAVKNHQFAAELLADGFPEAVLRETYCGTPCQIRIDWTNNVRETVVDLKTISDITRFENQFRNFRYANQMAFYAGVWMAKFGSLPSVSMIAVETAAPYRVGVWTLTPATLKDAKLFNETTIPKFITSKQSGIYPTNYENERTI